MLALTSMIAGMFITSRILLFLVFFFGVWGDVETGRYLEFSLSKGASRKETL